jgi:hypothetical protein
MRAVRESGADLIIVVASMLRDFIQLWRTSSNRTLPGPRVEILAATDVGVHLRRVLVRPRLITKGPRSLFASGVGLSNGLGSLLLHK